MTIPPKRKSTMRPTQLALFQAAKVGNISLMRELVNAGANLFSLDEGGKTVISYAYQANPEGIIEFLKELDIDLELEINKNK